MVIQIKWPKSFNPFIWVTFKSFNWVILLKLTQLSDQKVGKNWLDISISE